MKKEKKKKSGCCLGKLLVILILGLIAAGMVFGFRLLNLFEKAQQVVYPFGFKEEILEASEKYDLSPEFISAVIYTESKFNENAESSAGAKGLMQLLPSTFEWLRTLRGVSEDEELDIMDAKTNIDYGCYYISYLTKRYGDPYTAMAAYNAGHTRVDEWLSHEEYSKDGKTLDKIPFAETSNYVEKIKTAEPRYKKLYFN